MGRARILNASSSPAFHISGCTDLPTLSHSSSFPHPLALFLKGLRYPIPHPWNQTPPLGLEMTQQMV